MSGDAIRPSLLFGYEALQPAVIISGTLDVKSREIGFLVEELRRLGRNVITIDCGVLGEPQMEPTISRAHVASLGGADIEELRALRDRPAALAAMRTGLVVCVEHLHILGKVQGYFGLGGGTNASLAAAVFEILPYGVPKLLLSTGISGDVGKYVGIKDVVLMNTVIDVLGMNEFLQSLITTGAAIMDAMVGVAPTADIFGRHAIALTAFGCTTEAANGAVELLNRLGLETLTFHARGTGGRAAEAFMREGRIAGVLDLTITEIADEVVGGVRSAGPDRLDAAAELGLPQVILPGAIDVVNLGPPDRLPEKFKDRNILMHTPTSVLMRSNATENVEIARFVARKLNKAVGMVAVILPRRGFSSYDVEGGPFYDPHADSAFCETLIAEAGPNVRIKDLDCHINDRQCIETAVSTLRDMLQFEREVESEGH